MDKKKLTRAFLYSLFIVINQLLYLRFFGSKNVLVGIMLALCGIVFLNRDFTGRLLFRFSSFLAINLTLGIVSYIAYTNVYLGLVLNFITIFVTTFIYMNDYRQPTSFIFLMIYIFMYTSPVALNELPTRLIVIVIGIVVLMALQLIFNRNKFKDKSNALIISAVLEMKDGVDNLINDKYDEDLSVSVHGKIRNLIILIRERSHKSFKNNIYELNKFNIALCLSRLNMIISRTVNYSGDRTIKIKFLNNIKAILTSIQGYSMKENSLEDVKEQINNFISEYEDKVEKSKVIEETVYVFKIFILSINNSKEYRESVLSEIYTELNIPKENNLIEKIKESFNLDSLRARYSLKLAITMAVSIFVVSFLNLKHSSWVILSIYVVLQPYSEDSIKKAKERFSGVLFGVTIYFVIFSILKDSIPKTIVILIAFTLYFYYTEYNKKVIMTTIVSLSSISLVTGIGMLSFDRFVLVVLGICIALVFNKYLLPYDIEDSIKELKSKYIACTNLIVKELEDLKNGNGDLFKVIHSSMIKDHIESKLIQNENKVNNKEIEKLIFNESVIAGEGRYEFLKYYYLNFYNKDIK